MYPLRERSILLVDMNSYFASMEQLCNPFLRGKPVAVCGEGRTIVVTASYEARAYGVKTGMTKPEARKACPYIHFVVGDLEKYVGTSLQIHEIMLQFTDKVEVFSIDECFLDVTDAAKCSGDAFKIGREIKRELKERIGITCSVGIGASKTAAKIAAGMKKPDGLTALDSEGIKNIYHKLSVEELQGVGIGRKISRRLRFMGIKTAKDLAEADEGFLRSRFGIMGAVLKQIGEGTYSTPVKSYSTYDPVKSVGHSHTMARDTAELPVIKSYLMMLCEKTAFRMRKYGKTGRTVGFYIRWEDFTGFGKRHTVKNYINSGKEICDIAWEIFGEKLPLKKKVRLIGVSVSNLVPDKSQPYLLPVMQRKQDLLKVMDVINKRYGEFTVKPASLITAEKWGILERCGLIGSAWARRKN